MREEEGDHSFQVDSLGLLTHKSLRLPSQICQVVDSSMPWECVLKAHLSLFKSHLQASEIEPSTRYSNWCFINIGKPLWFYIVVFQVCCIVAMCCWIQFHSDPVIHTPRGSISLCHIVLPLFLSSLLGMLRSPHVWGSLVSSFWRVMLYSLSLVLSRLLHFGLFHWNCLNLGNNLLLFCFREEKNNTHETTRFYNTYKIFPIVLSFITIVLYLII